MQTIPTAISKFTASDIKKIEADEYFNISDDIRIELTDVEIISADIPGYIVSSNDGITVALDITITQKLKEEGLAREFVNRLQNLRKDNNFEVTDKVIVQILKNDKLTSAINNNLTYICDEILATDLEFVNSTDKNITEIELIDSITAKISIQKC